MGLRSKIHKLACYFLFRTKAFSRPASPEQAVLIEISSIPPNRWLYQIAAQFLSCNYACFLDLPFKRYLTMDIFGRRASLLKNVYPAKKRGGAAYSALISDNRETLNGFHPEGQGINPPADQPPPPRGVSPIKLFFNLRIFNNLGAVKKNDLFYPLLLHPDYLSPELEEEVFARGSNNHRKIAALFVGNVDSSYNRDITRALFHINTRYELFYHIENSLPGGMVYRPPSLDDFLTKIENEELKDKVVLLDIRRFSIPQDLWFTVLLKAGFFIHLAGSLQPYCHNHIESMLAGCIPVTALAPFYVPPFEDKINALLFNTPQELTGILRGICRGQYDPPAPFIRGKVLEYYKKYYSFESFKAKLDQLKAKDHTDGPSNYYIHCEVVPILNELLRHD
jgi:hypothetical protein